MRKVFLVLVGLFVLPAVSFGGEAIDFTWSNVQAGYDPFQDKIWVGGNVTSPEADTANENIELLTRPGLGNEAFSMNTIFALGGFFITHVDPGNGAGNPVWGVIAYDADNNWDGFGGQL